MVAVGMDSKRQIYLHLRLVSVYTESCITPKVCPFCRVALAKPMPFFHTKKLIDLRGLARNLTF